MQHKDEQKKIYNCHKKASPSTMLPLQALIHPKTQFRPSPETRI